MKARVARIWIRKQAGWSSCRGAQYSPCQLVYYPASTCIVCIGSESSGSWPIPASQPCYACAGLPRGTASLVSYPASTHPTVLHNCMHPALPLFLPPPAPVNHLPLLPPPVLEVSHVLHSGAGPAHLHIIAGLGAAHVGQAPTIIGGTRAPLGGRGLQGRAWRRMLTKLLTCGGKVHVKPGWSGNLPRTRSYTGAEPGACQLPGVHCTPHGAQVSALAFQYKHRHGYTCLQHYCETPPRQGRQPQQSTGNSAAGGQRCRQVQGAGGVASAHQASTGRSAPRSRIP